MPTRLQISEHQPGDAAEIFLRACSDHPVREQLRECQSAGQICEPHEQKKAERDQYIMLAGRHRTARLLLLILCRVWQRPFVLEHLSKIAAVHPTAAGWAPDEVVRPHSR